MMGNMFEQNRVVVERNVGKEHQVLVELALSAARA